MSVDFERGSTQLISFSGVDVGSVFNDLTAMTVCAWCKPESIVGDETLDVVTKWRFAATQDLGFTLYRSKSQDKWVFEVAYDDSNNTDTVVSSLDGTVGQWDFLAGRWTTTEIAIQVNQTRNTSVISRTSISDTATSTDLVIASQDEQSNTFDGEIEYVCIWDVDLSNDELDSLSRGVPPTRIRPANRLFLCTLANINHINDASGQGWQGTNVNSAVTGLTSPPVQPPFGFDLPVSPVTGAAPSGRIMSSLVGAGGLAGAGGIAGKGGGLIA